jgi:hypothetical protein
MNDKKRARRVFVLGAGASKACGLPLANELLAHVFQNDDLRYRNRLIEFIQYVYPRFDAQWGNYPNIEEFLSLVEVVLTFNEKVKSKHKFETPEIRKLRDDLLKAIAALLYRDGAAARVKGSPIFYPGGRANPRARGPVSSSPCNRTSTGISTFPTLTCAAPSITCAAFWMGSVASSCIGICVSPCEKLMSK